MGLKCKIRNFCTLGGIQNAKLWQTGWNTKCKLYPITNAEYKIQNNCKQGGIQNTKLLQTRWNTKCKIQNYGMEYKIQKY